MTGWQLGLVWTRLMVVLRILLAIGVAAAGALLLPVLTAAQTAPATDTHYVTVSGTMDLNDDETFTKDEHATYSFSSGSISLTHQNPKKTFVYSKCVGREVTGTLAVGLVLNKAERIAVSPKLYLYEGTSCVWTGQWITTPTEIITPVYLDADLDGTLTMTTQLAGENTSLAWPTVKVTNTDERVPDDYAQLSNFRVQHTVQCPSNQIRLSGRCTHVNVVCPGYPSGTTYMNGSCVLPRVPAPCPSGQGYLNGRCQACPARFTLRNGWCLPPEPT